MQRLTVWFTGLSGAGKTTLAQATADALADRGRAACVLDGDELRGGLSSDLGFSPADRDEQVRRTAEVARLMSSAGVIALVALVSPYRDGRLAARALHEAAGNRFVEIWVATPLATCRQRDPKGLYARACEDESIELTGVTAPYEPPATPELTLGEEGSTVAEDLARILALLDALEPAG